MSTPEITVSGKKKNERGNSLPEVSSKDLAEGATKEKKVLNGSYFTVEAGFGDCSIFIRI